MKSISFLSLFIVLLSYLSKAEVIKFNDLNFDKEIAEGQWMIYFYADWCGHCNRFAPVFEDVEAEAREKNLNIKFGKINIEENPQLASRFYITSLPTLFHIQDKQVRKFSIERTKENLIKFIENREWQVIKPRGYLASPFSVIGRWVGYASVIGAFITSFAKWIQQYINLWVLLGILTVVLFTCTYYFIKMNMPDSMKKPKTKKIGMGSGLKVELDEKEEENEKEKEKENKKHQKKE